MIVPHFRAWDNRLKTMRRGLYVGSGRCWDALCRTPRPHQDISKECELMMSAPIGDVENKMVFEYDVVLFEEKLYVVKYHVESASWILKPVDKLGATEMKLEEVVFLADAKNDSDFALVGNIFENRDLVNKDALLTVN